LHQGQYHKESQQGANVAADNRTKAGVDKNHIDPCFGKEKQEKFIPAVVKELALLLFLNRYKKGILGSVLSNESVFHSCQQRHAQYFINIVQYRMSVNEH